eukprot:TRINITY_DN12791_c0_g1_i1.p2 TRINITY_DN12791_c0_g1~~TRINITY_DN12791_c0_g1_i1.p2  ORF type:complete len:115 (-),score=18.80 TRINITY_DN12791_c0_g1_i1:201-545(-)
MQSSLNPLEASQQFNNMLGPLPMSSLLHEVLVKYSDVCGVSLQELMRLILDPETENEALSIEGGYDRIIAVIRALKEKQLINYKATGGAFAHTMAVLGLTDSFLQFLEHCDLVE